MIVRSSDAPRPPPPSLLPPFCGINHTRAVQAKTAPPPTLPAYLTPLTLYHHFLLVPHKQIGHPIFLHFSQFSLVASFEEDELEVAINQHQHQPPSGHFLAPDSTLHPLSHRIKKVSYTILHLPILSPSRDPAWSVFLAHTTPVRQPTPSQGPDRVPAPEVKVRAARYRHARISAGVHLRWYLCVLRGNLAWSWLVRRGFVVLATVRARGTTTAPRRIYHCSLLWQVDRNNKRRQHLLI